MEQKKLNEILEKHGKWLRDEEGGERADLRNANLWNANLSDAGLRNADLSDADLWNADLRNANLWNADLRNANLRNANLSDANLSDADLRNADTVNTLMYNLQCPEEGSFIGWKKCKNNVIVKLEICEEAKRSSATSRKCRASKVRVLEVFGAEEGVSKHDSTVTYKVGEILEIDNFDEDRWNECSTGIHFFITRKEAEDY